MSEATTGEAIRSRVHLGFVFGVLDAEAVPGPILVDLMAALGTGEQSTRQMLARMLRLGEVERQRVGRVSVYRLAGEFLVRWRRVRSGDQPPTWDGGYHLVLHEIPEQRRRTREALLSAAHAAGFGAPRPGVLIGLTEPDFATAYADEPVETGLFQVDLATARRLAWSAWRLDDRAGQIRQALGLLDELDHPPGRPVPPLESLRSLRTVIATGARAQITGPPLPVVLLPDDWPGELLGPRLAASMAVHQAGAGAYVYGVLAASPHAHLVVGGWWPEVAVSHEWPAGFPGAASGAPAAPASARSSEAPTRRG